MAYHLVPGKLRLLAVNNWLDILHGKVRLVCFFHDSDPRLRLRPLLLYLLLFLELSLPVLS